ncbi:MAG: hypothetical protein WBM85_11540 [Eudoraea sp.]
MRASVKYLVTAFLLVALSCKGQSPEQQKMMEDMEKKGQEAQRQYDSIMKDPQMKNIMQQVEEMEAIRKADRDKRNVEKQEKISIPENSKSNFEGYIISRSNMKKLDNWIYGEAKIVMVTLGPYSSVVRHNLGTISSEGSFDIQLPDKVATGNTIKENRWLSCGNFGDKGTINYSNSNSGIMQASLQIEKNDKPIGRLNMASAIELIDRWNPLLHAYHDIPGYRLEWYYVNGETSAKGQCIQENRYGDGKDFDLTKVYDIYLKQGWNLVKTAYNGERILIDWGEGQNNKHSYYREEKFTVVNSIPDDAKWVFSELSN